MSAGVGADIEALCSKCGDVWHVVVAKVGDKIAKVHCKQCGGDHRYRPVHGAPAEAKLPATKRAPKEPKAPVERFARAAVTADLAKAVRTYRASERFEVGDRVEHPSFGQGVVEISEPGKATVFFATGRRVLVQSKEASAAVASGNTLTRPKPFDHSNTAGGKRVSET